MKKIKELLNIGENVEIEFKECETKLPKSIWSTYSAFCNTNGGTIVLGIQEKNQIFTIKGVENVNSVLKSFWDTINNSQKVSNNILYNTDVQVKEIENKSIVIINIPKAPRQNKPIYINNNPITGTYKRNYEGDYLCTQKEVTDMLVEASNTSKDSMVIEGYTFDDLNSQTIIDYRNRYRNIVEVGNLWNNLSDIDFLKTIGAIDKKTNYLTLAGLLIFGNESDITRILPNYQLDYKELLDVDLSQDERWSNRFVSWNGMWSGNLYDFYTMVIRRLVVELEVPFKLDNEMYRIDTTPVHKAVREALVNCIVHTDYILSGIISVEKGINYFKFENPGCLRVPFEIAKLGGESDQRNPIIHKIFSLVGLGERTGSGLNMILKVWQDKKWEEPCLEEIYGLERVKLNLKMQQVNPPLNQPINPPLNQPLNSNKILNLISENPNIKIDEIASIMNLKPNTIKKYIRILKDEGLIYREGNNRIGKWMVAEDKENYKNE